MVISIAHLGPRGTYSEQAAIAYQRWRQQQAGEVSQLCSYPSILQAIQAVAQGQVAVAIVPVENSIEGSVAVTLDTLWQLETLQIQRALVLPITHTLLTYATTADAIETLYSHPQALGQCQQWIAQHCAKATLIPTRSTTEALQHLKASPTTGAIASAWAAHIYQVPVLATDINDQPDNCTKFWILSPQGQSHGSHTSIAFSLPINAPGALLRPLEIFAEAGINLSRIESRPTKRSLGEYLFFLDLEAGQGDEHTQKTLKQLENCTETLKVFGSYVTIPDARALPPECAPES